MLLVLIGKEDVANKQHALLLRAEAVAKEMKRSADLPLSIFISEDCLNGQYSVCTSALS